MPNSRIRRDNYTCFCLQFDFLAKRQNYFRSQLAPNSKMRSICALILKDLSLLNNKRRSMFLSDSEAELRPSSASPLPESIGEEEPAALLSPVPSSSKTKGGKSKRKSVSMSAVRPASPATSKKGQEERVTRSRSSSVKVLDNLFTPIKVKPFVRKEGTEDASTDQEPRRSKRFSVHNIPRKSYKF